MKAESVKIRTTLRQRVSAVEMRNHSLPWSPILGRPRWCAGTHRKYGVEDETSERGCFVNWTGILDGGIQTVLEKADTTFYAEPLLYSQQCSSINRPSFVGISPITSTLPQTATQRESHNFHNTWLRRQNVRGKKTALLFVYLTVII